MESNLANHSRKPPACGSGWVGEGNYLLIRFLIGLILRPTISLQLLQKRLKIDLN
jgi:hypothetical protein